MNFCTVFRIFVTFKQQYGNGVTNKKVPEKNSFVFKHFFWFYITIFAFFRCFIKLYWSQTAIYSLIMLLFCSDCCPADYRKWPLCWIICAFLPKRLRFIRQNTLFLKLMQEKVPKKKAYPVLCFLVPVQDKTTGSHHFHYNILQCTYTCHSEQG